MNLSVKKLKDGDILETIKFVYYSDKQAFVDKFAKLGILIEGDKDLEKLAQLANRGGDVRGEIRDLKGKPIMFEVRTFVRSIIPNPETLKQSEIKLINDL